MHSTLSLGGGCYHNTHFRDVETEQGVGGLYRSPRWHSHLVAEPPNRGSVTAQLLTPTLSCQARRPGKVKSLEPQFLHPSNGDNSACCCGGILGHHRKPDRELGEPGPHSPTHPGAPLPADEKSSDAAPGDTASPRWGALGAGGLRGPAAADADEVGSNENEAEAQTQAGQGGHQQ